MAARRLDSFVQARVNTDEIFKKENTRITTGNIFKFVFRFSSERLAQQPERVLQQQLWTPLAHCSHGTIFNPKKFKFILAAKDVPVSSAARLRISCLLFEHDKVTLASGRTQHVHGLFCCVVLVNICDSTKNRNFSFSVPEKLKWQTAGLPFLSTCVCLRVSHLVPICVSSPDIRCRGFTPGATPPSLLKRKVHFR